MSSLAKLLLFVLLVLSAWGEDIPLKSGQDPSKLLDAYEAAVRKRAQAEADHRNGKTDRRAEAADALAAAESELVPAYADQLVQEAADYLLKLDGVTDPQGQTFRFWSENIKSLRASGHIVIDTALKGTSTNAHVPFGPTFGSYTRTLKLNPDLFLAAAFEEAKRRARMRGESPPPILVPGPEFGYISENSKNPERLREAIVAFLAITLYHEKIHVHQYFLPSCREENREGPAHSCAVRAVYLMLNELYSQYLLEDDKARQRVLLERMLILTRLMRAKNSEFSEACKGAGWVKLKEAADDWISYYEKLLPAALKKGVSKGEFFELEKALQEKRRKAKIATDAKAEEKRVALLAPPAVTEHNFICTWTGMNRAAGHIFDLRLHNTGPATVSVSLAPGMVLMPPDPAFQRMMLGAPLVVDVPPGETREVPVTGYCLDPERKTPAAASLEYLTICPEMVPGFESFKSIVETGNHLAQEQAYKNLFEPQQYRDTVIQRALWYEATKNQPKPYDQEKLRQDLEGQLRDAGKNPDPKQVEKAAESLWSDVDLTLKKSHQ